MQKFWNHADVFVRETIILRKYKKGRESFCCWGFGGWQKQLQLERWPV